MRRFFPLLGFAVVLGLPGLAAAQGAGSNQEELRERYEKKLKKDFVKKVSWQRSLAKAKKLARKQNKPIFGYFSRSYAP